MPVQRVGGRVLIIDPADRLLLVHERLEDGSTHWLTPGGGVESGERPQHAAVREAAEEVGIDVAVPVDAEPVLVTRREWSWAGTTFDQTDHFYLVRVSAGLQAVPRGLTEVERQTLLGFGWWTAGQLDETSQTLVPPNLGEVLAQVLRAGTASG